jgi:hypothetical protein
VSARTCRCGCGSSLAGLRSDAVWASEACKKRGERERSRDKAGTGQPLQLVREDQAQKKHNRDLGGLIRQAIIDRIKTTGECFADDLVDLYPEGEVKECRRLATAQFGSLVASGLIRENGRRKSTIPARKGAKSGVYILTEKGRATLVGMGGGSESAVTASPASSAGHSSHSGENSGGAASASSSPSEPARLFEDAPLNPLADAEAA